MADALAKLQAGKDKASAALAKNRLGGREYDVQVAPEVAGDPLVDSGKTYGAAVTLSPRPSVELKTVKQWQSGAIVAVGDALVKGISRKYTAAELAGRWCIEGAYYTLVQLDAKPTEWQAIVKREA